MKKKITLNYIFNLISQLLILSVSLITTPYLSRILKEEGNGQYSYAFSIITYFVLAASLGFAVYGQREIAKCGDDKYRRSKVFYEVFLLKLLFSIISFSALIAITLTVGFGAKYNKLILILSLLVIGAGFDVNFLFQGLENFKLIATRNILLKLATLVGIFLLVKSEGDNWIYAAIMAISTVASYLAVWPSVFKNICRVKFSELKFKKHIKPTLIIFIPTLAATIYTVFDKTMIGLLAPNPDYANGCYEQAFKINNISLTIISAISPILIPRNANDFAAGKIDDLKKHLKFACDYVMMLSIPVIIGFLVLSNSISAWFLGEGYNEVPTLLRIMSIRLFVCGLTIVFGEQLFIAIGKEKYHSIATFSAAIVNVIVNLILIPTYGAIGAAIATAVSEITVMIVLGFFVYKSEYLSLKWILLRSIKYLISSAVMFVGIYYLQSIMGYSILSFAIIVAVGFIIYIIMLLILRDSFTYEIINTVLQTLKKFKKVEKNN